MEGCGFHVAFRGDVHWDIMGYRGFLYWGLPKNGWFVMQNLICSLMILGRSYFQKLPYSGLQCLFHEGIRGCSGMRITNLNMGWYGFHRHSVNHEDIYFAACFMGCNGYIWLSHGDRPGYDKQLQ